MLDAPAPVFDAWISQTYEEITDIDRQAWDIYARWDILNDAIGNGDLLLTRSTDDTFSLEEVVQAEEKMTGPEEISTGQKENVPELQTSTAKGE